MRRKLKVAIARWLARRLEVRARRLRRSLRDYDRVQWREIHAAERRARGLRLYASWFLREKEAISARIKADLDDCTLTSPRDGRVQNRITEVGEVLGVGGKVLNVVDLADVYMTFFLPEKDAGHVDVGADARIILDAAPELVIPAKISYVASVAQFAPKTVETATERQKLTFRLKAQIDPELLRKHLTKVKTGLPGVAWAKRDPRAEWPAQLAVKLPE